MRRIIMLFLIICCLWHLTGCVANTTQDTEKLRGVWLSYYELDLSGKTEQEFKTYVADTFDRIIAAGFNAVFCHVRANADALYPSEFFPWSVYAAGTQGQDPGYDPLEYMVTTAHQKGLQFHAWINPYRVSNQTSDPTSLCSVHIARQWAEDSDPGNDHYVRAWNNGLYFDPSVPEVQKLIIDGVREIVERYTVDGIHFDDYFYPTTDPAFDEVSYAAYTGATAHPLELADWRRANVNVLISAVYRVVHSVPGIVFGVSPAAHISNNKTDRNYTESYADIALWAKSNAYIDYIAPQLYFGYDYPLPEYQFTNLLSKWVALPRYNGVKLYIGLAGYKIGDADQTGAQEWLNNTDILARQTQDSYAAGVDGVILFSYNTLTSSDPLSIAQMGNLTDVFNKSKDE